jgi:hypothetical protein
VGLTEVQATCERIKGTPLPFPYTLLHRTIYIFCLLLPFALAEPLGWLAPLFTTIVGYTFFGLDAIGNELEDPFGRDENDLPTDAMVRTVERRCAGGAGGTAATTGVVAGGVCVELTRQQHQPRLAQAYIGSRCLTKLQGRCRASSCSARIPSHAVRHAPVEPGRQHTKVRLASPASARLCTVELPISRIDNARNNSPKPSMRLSSRHSTASVCCRAR